MKHLLRYLLIALTLAPFISGCEDDSSKTNPGTTAAASIIITSTSDIKVVDGELNEPITGVIKTTDSDVAITAVVINAETSSSSDPYRIFGLNDLIENTDGSYSFTITTDDIALIINVIKKINILVTVEGDKTSTKTIDIATSNNNDDDDEDGDGDGGDMGKATITFTNEAPIEVTRYYYKLSEPISGTVRADKADAIIESITIDAYISTDENPVRIATMSNLNLFEKNSDREVRFFIPNEYIASIISNIWEITRVEVTAKVVDGETTIESIPVVANPWLSEVQPFTWQRVDATRTGLDKFGLIWSANATVNTTVNAIIKANAATKLVELESSAWNSIKTAEELKTAVDNADEIAQYDRVIVSVSIASYDHVLAVNKDGLGEYYIIHIENSTATGPITGPNGDYVFTYTITGNYKEGFILPRN